MQTIVVRMISLPYPAGIFYSGSVLLNQMWTDVYVCMWTIAERWPNGSSHKIGSVGSVPAGYMITILHTDDPSNHPWPM